MRPRAAVRRAEAAGRHRARVRRRSAHRRLRRADLGAGRLGAGGDPEPAGRPAAQGGRQPISSSRTTSAWCATCPTGSRVLYLGTGDGARRRRRGLLRRRTIPIPRRCSRPCPAWTAAKRERIRLEGEIPSPADPPTGCVFHTRCPRKIGAICETTEPPLAEAEPGHAIRCHIPLEELRRVQAAPSSPTAVGGEG